MKQLLQLSTFVAALTSAFITSTEEKPFATKYYEAIPANKTATCRFINCTEDWTQPVCVASAMYSMYKSPDGTEPCSILATLRKPYQP